MKKFLSLQLFFFLFISANASNYYWVNGSGSWSDYTNHWAVSSGGSVFHVQTPTPSDDVFFDANSFATTGDTVFIDTTLVNCRTLDISSVTNFPAFGGSGSISIYGSFYINGNCNWDGNDLLFKSSSPGNIINTSGCTLVGGHIKYPSFSFDGTGSWSLQNDLDLDTINFTYNGSVIVYNGTLITNSHSISCNWFQLRTNGIALLGTSQITCGDWESWAGSQPDADSAIIYCNSQFDAGKGVSYYDVFAGFLSSGDSCTFHDVTAYNINNISHSSFHNVIMSNNSNASVASSQCVYNKLIFQANSSSIRNNNIIDSLIFNNAGMTISILDTQTVNSYLQMNGSCAGLTLLNGNSSGVINMSSGNTMFNYLMIQNIAATGGATFTANNSIDNGNVTGITINSPAPLNLYWVGGTGNWDDVSHWATSSGGAGGSCVPSVMDNVYFDANSFPSSGDSVYINVNSYCNNLDLSAATNNPVITGSFNISVYGSFIVHGNVNWDGNSLLFKSSSPGNIINTSGCTLIGGHIRYPSFSFDGTGSWSLQNDLDLDTINFTYNGSVIVYNGTLITNNHSISCDWFQLRTNGIALLGTSQITCGDWESWAGSQPDADSAIIYCNSQFDAGKGVSYYDVFAGFLSSGDSCTFHDVTAYNINNISHSSFHNVIMSNNSNASVASSQCVYNKLIFQANSSSIRNNNIIDSLIFNNAGMTISILDTQTVNSYLQMNGSCAGLTLLNGNSSGVINMPSGNTMFNYLMIQNIAATGGATFTANNSIDNGNVTGITINSPAPLNLYWVGGTGNWDDVSHWATSSGGAGGSCVPSVMDNVYFDANSFPSANDSVNINITGYCNNLDLSAATNNPVITGSFDISIYGSFIVHGNVNWDGNDLLFKSSSPGNIINTSGCTLVGGHIKYPSFSFDGTGSWSLQNDLDLDTINFTYNGSVIVYNGTLITNNHSISCNWFQLRTNGIALLGTSQITCGDWESWAGSQPDADSAIIYCNSQFDAGKGVSYYDVFAGFLSSGDSCTFHDVTAYNINNISHSSFHNVIMSNNSNASVASSQCVYNKLIFQANSSSIRNNNIIDSLIFNNAGMTISILDTQTVNSLIHIKSDPGFPTSINGGTISFNDTICADYIYIQNNSITGGGQYYAGDHSVDLGGNTGWTFASCAPIFSNVWPGDANYDLIVDNIDLLYIGIAYGDTGYVRAGATNNYVAQPCQDWFYQFQNTTNVKKADSDGNGIIETADTVAISLNYGLSHPFRLAQNNQANTAGTDLILQMPAGQAVPGTNVNIPIILGTGSNPATDVYGIAFTINFEQSMVQQGSLNIDFTNCWIEPGNNHLSLVKDFSAAGKCDLAFTRIDGNNITGNGIIGNLSFTVANNAMGFMHFTITKIKLISHDEIDIPVATHADSTYTSIDQLSEIGFSVYPNPSKDKVTIQFNNKNHNEYFISLYDVSGQVVYSKSTSNDFIEINGKEFESGMYYVLINDSEKNLFRGKILFY